MRLTITITLAAVVAAAFYFGLDFSRLGAWAVEAQRGFQNQMAQAVRALKAGEPGAYFALLGATGAYGFVHALGPGHGKVLVGGVGLGSRVTPARLLTLAIVSSVMQAIWAIILVYGGFSALSVTAQRLTSVTEDVLAPASYLAIACVGLLIAWRGFRALKRTVQPEHTHHHDTCGCHSHGPTIEQAEQVQTLRQAVGLIASIAIRPCTGAIFLLVIAWQMDIKLAGALAVLVMGLGTAALTSLVAVSSIAARNVTFMSLGMLNGLQMAVPVLQIAVGIAVVLVSLGFLGLV